MISKVCLLGSGEWVRACTEQAIQASAATPRMSLHSALKPASQCPGGPCLGQFGAEACEAKTA